MHTHQAHADGDNIRHYGKEKTARGREMHGRLGGGFRDQKTDANHFTDSLPND